MPEVTYSRESPNSAVTHLPAVPSRTTMFRKCLLLWGHWNLFRREYVISCHLNPCPGPWLIVLECTISKSRSTVNTAAANTVTRAQGAREGSPVR